MATIQGSSIRNAWIEAIASYKRDLNAKQLQTVQASTSPEMIVAHMEQLEKDRLSSRSGKIMNQVKSITDRLVRFSKVVDVMTTSNAEASLIWGSLKLLLTIVHQSLEVYEKICQSLITVGESLQVVELLAETFAHSDLVSNYVVRYYCSILHYWRKAIKHYRRRKFINIIRGAWHDYNSEFGDFEEKMTRLREETQKAAHAVDMSEARKARQQQDKSRTESVDKSRTIEESKRHREIIRWLAPSARDASYYVDDFRTASKDRHPGTCEWILRKSEFQQWIDSDGTDPQVRMLWISAIAGAGKTVLAASIIAHCQAKIKSSAKESVIYFFFKNTDDEKNSLLSMTRSFLHQFYISFGTDDFRNDLASLKDNSGKDYMLSDERAWEMFVKHAGKASGMTVVLDALDECRLLDIGELLDRLCLLATMSEIRVIVTSRREEKIRVKLESWPCIQIQQQDVDADISCFVTAKIGNMSRLSSKPLRDRIIQKLSSSHEGMFLWVFLMIKELKSLATVGEVEERLLAIPGGLRAMHEAIISRLSTTLSDSERSIALKVLSWVVSAIRPLRLAEIHEILRFEIERSREKDDLLYSEKDIELICGSLVTTRNGVLQLIHLSTKEILQKRPDGLPTDNPCWPFYVDMQETGPQNALLCASYMTTHQETVDSYTRPGLTPISRLEYGSYNGDIRQIVGKAHFIEYASTSWQAHLIDGPPEEGIIHVLQSLLSYRFTILWVEFCFAQDPDSSWKLRRNCIAMQDWIARASVVNGAENANKVGYVQGWCKGILDLLDEYGLSIKDFHTELHYLDLRPIFSSQYLTEFHVNSKGEQTRERAIRLTHDEGEMPKPEIEPHRVALTHREGYGGLGFFLYDEKRDVFYYSEPDLSSEMETLWVQDRQTGRRLHPMKKTWKTFWGISAISAVLSRDWRYLGVSYSTAMDGLCTTIWEIEDKFNFHDIKQSQPWARRIQLLWANEGWFEKSCCPLTIGPDDLFCTPSGLVDPQRGIRRPLPVMPADMKPFPVMPVDIDNSRASPIAAFSGDGRILFIEDPPARRIYKIFWLDLIPNTEILDLSALPLSSDVNTAIRLSCINHDGNYLVVETINKVQGSDHREHVSLMNTSDCTAKLLLDHDDDLLDGQFWNTSLILMISRYGSNSARLLRHWDDITQDTLKYQEIKLGSLHSAFRLQMIDRSTKAFCVLDDSIIHEVDMRDLISQLSTEMQSYPINTRRTRRHHSQVSGDGCYVGLVYGVSDDDDPIADGESLFVQITDLRLLKNNSKHMRLHVAVAASKPVVVFNIDLSILYANERIYDLLATTDDMMAVPFSYSNEYISDPVHNVIFSPCNRYVCFLIRRDFKLYEICRSTRTLMELSVRGAKFSSYAGPFGKFHPNLPILLLAGGLVIADDGGDNGDDELNEVIEVDLSTLEAVNVPPPHPILQRLYSPYIEFSSCGRFAWITSHSFGSTCNQIPRSYSLDDERLIDKVPSVWQESVIYDLKSYELSLNYARNFVLLQLHQRLKGGRIALKSQVLITSFPSSMKSPTVFLLPGHEEEDPARVLLVPEEEGPAVIKLLPVTMKQILTKLDEMAEVSDSQTGHDSEIK